MEYTFLDDIERMHTVAFYQSYYYGTGEKSELITSSRALSNAYRMVVSRGYVFHEK